MELKDVLTGLPTWKEKVPSLIIFYALAMWQIYRAHAEAALDGICIPAVAMFARWQGEVMRRIRIDNINAARNNRMDRFEANWVSIRCQWFVFERGGGEPGRGRVEFDPTFAAILTITNHVDRSNQTAVFRSRVTRLSKTDALVAVEGRDERVTG